MIEQIMFWVVLGHFVGDYLLQSKKMALGKSARGWPGVWQCTKHCLAYTCAVAWSSLIGLGHVLDPASALLVVAMIFVSHYPIDRWSLGGRWLQMIKGRALLEHPGVLVQERKSVEVVAMNHAFAAIVYTVVDNTMHILLLTAGFAVLLHWGVL